ncbi:MAG: hypothetical protein ACYC6I_11110 [Bacillota bacterium]
MEERPVPADVPSVFQESWRMFASGWTQYLTVMLIIYIPAWVISALLAVSLGLPIRMGTASSFTPGTNVGTLVGPAAIVMIVGAVLSAIESAAVVSLFDMQWHNQPLDWQAGIRRGLPFIWTIIATTVLVALMTMVGFVLLIIPGVVVIFLMSLTVQAIVLDHMSVIAAITASARAASRAFVPIVVIILTVLFAGLLVSFVFRGTGALANAISAVFSIILSIWSAIAMGLAYLHGSRLAPAGGTAPQGPSGGSPVQ